MDMVDFWCNFIQENGKIVFVRFLFRVYRIVCYYGDDGDDGFFVKLLVMFSDVFNKIMFFILSKMDGIFRDLMKFFFYGGKKEKMMDVKNIKQWKMQNYLVKLYLGNLLYVLN